MVELCFVYIILYNLASRKRNKVLSGASFQFWFLGSSHLELSPKYLLWKRILSEEKDLITPLNSFSINTSLTRQVLDIKISPRPGRKCVNISYTMVGWWDVRCIFMCGVYMGARLSVCLPPRLFGLMWPTTETGNLPPGGWNSSFRVIAVDPWSPHLSPFPKYPSVQYMVEILWD